MILDNVLAVAGAARDHPTVLFFGLALSVTLMAVAANLIARIIERYHWIAYIGLAVILYVAGSMIFDGWVDPEIGVGHLFRDRSEERRVGKECGRTGRCGWSPYH